jgi:hypothetical protein
MSIMRLGSRQQVWTGVDPKTAVPMSHVRQAVHAWQSKDRTRQETPLQPMRQTDAHL